MTSSHALAVKSVRVSGLCAALTSLTASLSAQYASPQTEEVINSGEGRIGLLGGWREVLSQFGSAVVFDLMTLSFSFSSKIAMDFIME